MNYLPSLCLLFSAKTAILPFMTESHKTLYDSSAINMNTMFTSTSAVRFTHIFSTYSVYLHLIAIERFKIEKDHIHFRHDLGVGWTFKNVC